MKQQLRLEEGDQERPTSNKMETSEGFINFIKNLGSNNLMVGPKCGAAFVITINDKNKKVYITKDYLNASAAKLSDLFVLKNFYGETDIREPISREPINISTWSPIFLNLIARGATGVVFSTTKWSLLAEKAALKSWQQDGGQHPNLIRLAHWEILTDVFSKKELLIPIVGKENLQGDLKSSLELYPDSCAVLISNYGLLVWGNSLQDLSSKLETIEYLFELQVNQFKL